MVSFAPETIKIYFGWNSSNIEEMRMLLDLKLLTGDEIFFFDSGGTDTKITPPTLTYFVYTGKIHILEKDTIYHQYNSLDSNKEVIDLFIKNNYHGSTV